MAVQIQLRRGTAANWTASNPTLAMGELGMETDTAKIKMGDGATAWNTLGYFGGAPSGAAGGDLSGTYPNPTVAANAVGNTKLRDSGALSVIGRSANSAGDPADVSATAASDAVLRESGSTVGFGTVATAGIANAAITLAKMANLAANSILGNNTGAGATPLALTAAQVKTLLAIAQADVAGLLTSSSPQFAGIELGNASDTSLTRLAAGVLGVEGKTVNVWDGVIVKSATESRTSTAVLANDADFAAALTSGKMYYIEFLLLYDSPVGGGTPDMNLACGEDATGRGIFQRNGWSTGDAANTNEFIANQTATTGLGTATTPRSAIIRGTYVSGGGTFRLLWCQAVSGANPSRILAGSQMRYQLIG